MFTENSFEKKGIYFKQIGYEVRDINRSIS